MVDFRTSGVTSSRSYSRSGSSRSSSRSGSRSTTTRKKKREDAFSRPALGQAIPGALTAADPGTYSGSVAFQPTPSRYPLVQRGGETLALGASPSTQQVPELGMSEAFAKKAAGVGTMQEMPLDFGAAGTGEEAFRQAVFGDQQARPGENMFKDGTFQGTGDMATTGGFAPNTEGGVLGWIKAQIQDQLNLMNADPTRTALTSVVSPLLSVGGVALSTNQLSTLMRGTRAGDTLKVGTLGLSGGKGTAGRIAVNTATAKQTTTWLGKLARYARNPSVVAGAILGAIGSYPFAGFIKEEALQTTGFATRTALQNNDLQGAAEAIALQDEILDPGVWRQITAKVPYGNVLGNLKDYYKAARLQSDVYKQIYADKVVQGQAGESEDMKWERVRQQEADQYQANIDYYNQQRKQMLEWELAAREASKARDRAGERAAYEREAAFWRKERERQRKLEEEERKRIAEFWLEYRKAVLELEQQYKQQTSSAGGGGRSTLGFGLLR